MPESKDQHNETPPAEQIPAGTESKPKEAAGLRDDQQNALQRAIDAHQEFMQLTGGGLQKAPDAEWLRIHRALTESLEAAQSIPIDLIDEQLNQGEAAFEHQLARAIAEQKYGGVIGRVSVADITQRRDQMIETISEYTAVIDAIEQQVAVELEERLINLQRELDQKSENKSDDEKQALIQEYEHQAQKAVVEARESLSAALANPDERKRFFVVSGKEENYVDPIMNLQEKWCNVIGCTPTADATQSNFSLFYLAANDDNNQTASILALLQNRAAIEQLRTAPDLIRVKLAESLIVQDQRDLAKAHLEEAVKNPAIDRMLLSSEEGFKLLLGLEIISPTLKALKDEVAPEPEAALLKQARQAFADGKWDESFSLFEQAIEIADKQGVRLEQLLSQMHTLVNSQPSAQTVPLLWALRQGAESLPSPRLEYALALNEYGVTHDDAEARHKAVEILRAIASVAGLEHVQRVAVHKAGNDSETLDKYIGELYDLVRQFSIPIYELSPEIMGAIEQAKSGRKIDLKTAASEGFVRAAHSQFNGGILDSLILLPGASAVGEVFPVVGPILFADNQQKDRAIDILAESYLRDAAATEAALSRQSERGSSLLRDTIGDVSSIVAGYASRWGLAKVAPKALERAGVWGKAGSFALQVLAAGETRSLIDRGRLTLPTDSSFLRGAGMYGIARGADGLMRGVASRTKLSAQTLEQISARYQIPADKLGNSARSVQAALQEKQTSLAQQVLRAETGEIVAARSLLHKHGYDARLLDQVAGVHRSGITSAVDQLKAGLRAKGASAAELASLDSAVASVADDLLSARLLAQTRESLAREGKRLGVFSPKSSDTLVNAWLNGQYSLQNAQTQAWLTEKLGIASSAFVFGAGRRALYAGTGDTSSTGDKYDFTSAESSG